MASQDNQGRESGPPVEVPQEHSKEGAAGQLEAAFTEAAKQVGDKDINDPEKIDWLLSKLELSQKEKDGLFELLQKQAKTKGPQEALDLWKLAVLTTWDNSTEYAGQYEKEEL